MMPVEQPDPIVLLAEDSEDDAFFFRRAFSKAGVTCSLIRAGNGKQAIELLESGRLRPEHDPFLVFLDLKMPVMNGFEVLEWLAQNGRTPGLNVVVLSGSNDHADRARAARLGANDYLVKPISPEVLRHRLLADLEKWRAAQSASAAAVAALTKGAA